MEHHAVFENTRGRRWGKDKRGHKATVSARERPQRDAYTIFWPNMGSNLLFFQRITVEKLSTEPSEHVLIEKLYFKTGLKLSAYVDK